MNRHLRGNKIIRALMFIGLVSLICLWIAGGAQADEFVSVDTPNGAQGFLYLGADKPVASVILFAGGHGWLNLDGASIGWGKSNFLVRTRDLFQKHGFQVAVVDTPSYKKKINAKFRMDARHVQDIKAVSAFLKSKADVPVWAIGTSMGTFSSASMALAGGADFQGAIMTSSITRSARKWSIYNDYPNGVIDMNLGSVNMPVLVMSHSDDGCDKTPAADADKLAAAFTGAPRVEVKILSGGSSPTSAPCQAKSQHGFLGIEAEAVDAIAAFIKAN